MCLQAREPFEGRLAVRLGLAHRHDLVLERALLLRAQRRHLAARVLNERQARLVRLQLLQLRQHRPLALQRPQAVLLRCLHGRLGLRLGVARSRELPLRALDVFPQRREPLTQHMRQLLLRPHCLLKPGHFGARLFQALLQLRALLLCVALQRRHFLLDRPHLR